MTAAVDGVNARLRETTAKVTDWLLPAATDFFPSAIDTGLPGSLAATFSAAVLVGVIVCPRHSQLLELSCGIAANVDAANEQVLSRRQVRQRMRMDAKGCISTPGYQLAVYPC
jgi:hypothetical protein